MRSDSILGILRPVLARVRGLFGRGVATRVDEGGDLIRVQARFLAGEVRDELELLGHYGLASRPLPGAEVVVLFYGGARDQGVGVSADDRRARPKDLEPGESGLYSIGGNRIRMLPDGSIEISVGAGSQIRVAGDVALAGSLALTGSLAADGDVGDGASSPAVTLAQMRQTFNTHTHPENGGGGPTGPPLVPM